MDDEAPQTAEAERELISKPRSYVYSREYSKLSMTSVRTVCQS